MGDMLIGTTAPLPEAIAEYLAACEAEGQSRATLAWKRAVLRRFAHYADSVAAGDVGALTLELARRWQRHLRTTPMAHPRRKPGHEGERRGRPHRQRLLSRAASVRRLARRIGVRGRPSLGDVSTRAAADARS